MNCVFSSSSTSSFHDLMTRLAKSILLNYSIFCCFFLYFYFLHKKSTFLKIIAIFFAFHTLEKSIFISQLVKHIYKHKKKEKSCKNNNFQLVCFYSIRNVNFSLALVAFLHFQHFFYMEKFTEQVN